MRAVTRPNGIAVIIAPRGGHGRHVFRNEAARLQALYDIPDEHVILFDHDAPQAVRFAYVNAELRRIARSLPRGVEILTVFVLRHGYPKGGQEGVWTSNVDQQVDACDGRLARDVNWIFLSCSNAATIGRNPDGDMSLADAMRDALCRAGYVDCMTYGHLIAGHATYLLADRAGGTWRPLARRFFGHGSPTGGVGGEPVLPKGDPLLDDAYRLMRKSIDPDDDGPEPAMPFRFVVPFFESQDEMRREVARYAGQAANDGTATPTRPPAAMPSVEDLQRALARGSFMELPTANDGLGTYGPRTKAGVRAFQASAGIRVDGDAGPQTFAALRAAGLIDAQAA